MSIAANKMMKHLDRVVGEHRPITADVFLTNFCNNRCSWCTYGRWENDGAARYMTAEAFEMYFNRMLDLGVRGVILTGGGEPTINRDFLDITRILEHRGVPYGVNTNLNRMYYIRPEYLKVSLDGYDEDSYEAVRGVRAYNTVRENIIKYGMWKRDEAPEVNLGIQMVATDPDCMVRFYEKNCDLPVDYIVYRPIESTNGAYYIDHDHARIVEVAEQLAKIDNRVKVNFKFGMLGKRFSSCTAHWAQIAIDENGNVMYCCHKPYQIVGHIMDEDILEKHSKAVTDMCKCDVPCRMTAPNIFIEECEKPVGNVPFI